MKASNDNEVGRLLCIQSSFFYGKLNCDFRFQKILKNLKSWNKIYWLFDVSWLSRLLNFFPASLVGCWELSRRAFSLVVSKLRHRWAVSKIITTVTRKIKRQTSSSKIWRKQIDKSLSIDSLFVNQNYLCYFKTKLEKVPCQRRKFCQIRTEIRIIQRN